MLTRTIPSVTVSSWKAMETTSSLLGKINRPHASSGAKVENSLRIWIDGCEMELAPH